METADIGRVRRQREIWTSYAYLSIFAYLLYALGNLTPYLRDDLHLSDFQAGLHATAMACGTLTAGILSDSAIARIGTTRAVLFAVLCGIAASAGVAGAPFVAVSLIAAYLIGLGGGTLGTYVNITLGSSGGPEARKLVARANAWSMAAALVGPFLIAAAASLLGFWRLALFVPIVAFGIVALTGSTSHSTPAMRAGARQRLPRSFWLAWLFLVLAVAIEFSFVFWASTLVSARTGVAKETGTVAAGLFVVGMLLGRIVAGLSQVARLAPRGPLAAGLSLAAAGIFITWVGTDPRISAVGSLLAGTGVAGLYPIGVAVAFRLASAGELAASARITLAAGVAIFAAPTVLGLLSDQIGVVAAWPIVLALVAIAFLLALAATSRQPAVVPSAGASNKPATDKYRSPVS